MRIYKLSIILIVLFFIGIKTTIAQSYQFSKYGIENGLPQQYVYSINQDNKGFIWIGTGEGVSKFDGIEFINYTSKDGLAENFITCSSQKQKNIIWYGHNKGGISRVVNGVISTIVLDSLVNSKITSIAVDQDNYVWAVSQNGFLIKITPKLIVTKFDLFNGQKIINCIEGRIDNNLLVGTDQGLYLVNLNNKLEPAQNIEISPFKLKSIQCITKSNSLENNYWIGSSENGLYQLKFDNNLKPKTRHYDDSRLNNTSVQDIKEDYNKNLWISTFSGLYKLVYDKKMKGVNQIIRYASDNGLSDFIKHTFIDRENNTWISTYGEGIAMLKDELFVYYSHEDKTIPNDTRSFLFQDSVKWFGLSSGLLKITPFAEQKWKYYSSINGFEDIPVTSIVQMGENLYLGTDGKGLYQFNIKSEKFKKEYLITSYLSNSINKIIKQDSVLWIATEGGIVKKDYASGKSDVFNTLSGLKHNSIYDLILQNDNSIILSSHSNQLTVIKNNSISHLLVADIQQPMDIVSMYKDNTETLWLATLGNGVFKQQADSFIQITTNNGLKSDYCYSVVADNKNGIWIGHRGGLSRISSQSLEVDIFDKKKGINDDFNKGAIYNDINNNLWFGTNKRAIKFNQKKYLKNTFPPIVSVKEVYISDQKIPFTETIELPYKAYKLKIEFIGISFKQPEGVKYQYFLEGHDLNWSESSTSNIANYPRIDDGEYTFYVKACNTDGVCSEETQSFKITIAAPFWKKWWFYFLTLLTIVLIVYLIIKQREKKQKEIQASLELELAKRTKEVVKKNSELEDKNKNITDSINYALRIQKSILPSKRLMKELFPESFVFYKPRDIVSGDFYWYERIGNKFIVACADCTGHGVPGAFMSMISSTLLKEIAHQEQITEPSKFLFKLDELLMNTLKKTGETSIHDGLDLSLCVFDLDTNLLSFSGAFRPVLLYQNKILERYKTFPYSIGGGDFIKKEFETINIQLEKGDIVYLFTDGYPDQFGGERGKKLYLKGFQDLINSCVELGMDEQHRILSVFLKDWMGNKNQIDDVLVMGIKIT